MRHLMDITDLSLEELNELLTLGEDMIARPEDFFGSARGKKLATLFFEPSTRTRLSFEAAMLDLGGSVIGFSDSSASSSAKGESVADTIRTVGCYADLIAMRHPMEGASMMGACKSPVPVINAGDGGHCHPTQTLADLLTIRRERGQLCNMTVGMVGDLKYGRTIHSLISALARYTGVRLVLISPPELAIPRNMKAGVLQAMEWSECPDIAEALPQLDVIYMTRIQRERFAQPDQYRDLEAPYMLDQAKMTLAKKDAIVLHPLPRVGEIAADVDDDPRAAYFRQMKNGKFIRMALLHTLLHKNLASRPLPQLRDDLLCYSTRCITSTQREPEHRFFQAEDGRWRCLYCERAHDPSHLNEK